MNRSERNWTEFASRYPAEAAWLQSPASGDFGASLVKGCKRYGGLTPRQLAAVQRNVTVFPAPVVDVMPAATFPVPECAHPDTVAYVEPVIGQCRNCLRPIHGSLSCSEAAAPHDTGLLRLSTSLAPRGTPLMRLNESRNQDTADRVADNMRTSTLITIDADPVRRAMDAAAASGLRKVKLTLGAVRFALSGPRFRHGQGMILCYENGSYAGFIDRANVFRVAQFRTVTPSMLEAFRAAAADPQAAARTHGQATGRCACCGRTLTDPESIAMSIGPICAGRWGWR